MPEMWYSHRAKYDQVKHVNDYISRKKWGTLFPFSTHCVLVALSQLSQLLNLECNVPSTEYPVVTQVFGTKVSS